MTSSSARPSLFKVPHSPYCHPKLPAHCCLGDSFKPHLNYSKYKEARVFVSQDWDWSVHFQSYVGESDFHIFTNCMQEVFKGKLVYRVFDWSVHNCYETLVYLFIYLFFSSLEHCTRLMWSPHDSVDEKSLSPVKQMGNFGSERFLVATSWSTCPKT